MLFVEVMDGSLQEQATTFDACGLGEPALPSPRGQGKGAASDLGIASLLTQACISRARGWLAQIRSHLPQQGIGVVIHDPPNARAAL